MSRIFCLLSLFFLVSCSKVLDQVPEFTIAEDNYWQTANDAESAAVGIYPTVQALAQQSPLAFDAASDAATVVNNVNYAPFSNHRIPVDNTIIATYWQNNYTGIGRANDLLKHVPGMRDSLFTTGQKERILGEAYFLRAYLYFNLVRAWGAVPIVTQPYTSFNADFTIARSSVDSVYGLIVSDLHAAEGLLPASWPTAVDTRGRATLGSAQALLAKTFLSMKLYDSAAANALDVMNNTTLYSLVTGATAYNNMFSTNGRNGSESIFEIQYISSTQQGHGLYSFYMPVNGLPAGIQTGSYQIAPTAKIAAAFQIGDIRQKASVSVNTPVAPNLPVPYVNKYPRLTSGAEPNIIALRLADIILVRAEALNNLGQTAAATDLLNTIRRRAFAQPLPGATIYDFPNADDLANGYDLSLAIENERFKELAFEGNRFYDLVRTGRAAAVLGISADQSLWPIPLREIQRNPRLVQNNGY